MSYYLKFALNLKRDGSQVSYHPETFVRDIVVISLPEVLEIVKRFVDTLEQVEILENYGNIIHGEKAMQASTYPRSIDATAYICKVRDLSKFSLECLYSDITTYLTKALSKISEASFVSSEIDISFAGIREIIELRNYLIIYVDNRSKKKIYEEGYVYFAKD